jgi:hypothetical protein
MPIVCECSNPIKVETKNSNATLIINDTLKISAYLAECGEFGGHREQIKIYQLRGLISGGESDILGADFLVDTVTCPSNNNWKRVFKKIKTKTLTSADKKLVLLYAKELTEKSLNETGLSNAGKVYRIECTMPRIAIYYVDIEQDWDGFFKMRNTLFTKNK